MNANFKHNSLKYFYCFIIHQFSGSRDLDKTFQNQEYFGEKKLKSHSLNGRRVLFSVLSKVCGNVFTYVSL